MPKALFFVRFRGLPGRGGSHFHNPYAAPALQLKSTHYTSEGYAYIRKFFEDAVTLQNKSYIVLEKE